MMKTFLLFALLSIGHRGFAQNPDSLPHTPATVHGVTARSEGVSFRLTGIYTHDEIVFYCVEATNRSALVYDIDLFRCSIRDRKEVKRHAYQEVPLVPLWIHGDPLRLGPGKTGGWIIALPKEVLPADQYLSIRLLERSGSRNLELRVGHRQQLRARVI